jgi:hypothetical protein
MTSGKKADSLMPRNHRKASNPPKFLTEETRRVKHPKENIMQGSTLFGPYFLPKTPKNGAVKTYGTKNTDRMVLQIGQRDCQPF